MPVIAALWVEPALGMSRDLAFLRMHSRVGSLVSVVIAYSLGAQDGGI